MPYKSNGPFMSAQHLNRFHVPDAFKTLEKRNVDRILLSQNGTEISTENGDYIELDMEDDS